MSNYKILNLILLCYKLADCMLIEVSVAKQKGVVLNAVIIIHVDLGRDSKKICLITEGCVNIKKWT